MGQRKRAQREQQLGTAARRAGPSAGRTNGEDNMLRTPIAPGPQPLCKDLGTHRPAAAIEQHRDDGYAALLPLDPVQHRFFAAKTLRLAARKG